MQPTWRAAPISCLMDEGRTSHLFTGLLLRSHQLSREVGSSGSQGNHLSQPKPEAERRQILEGQVSLRRSSSSGSLRMASSPPWQKRETSTWQSCQPVRRNHLQAPAAAGFNVTSSRGVFNCLDQQFSTWGATEPPGRTFLKMPGPHHFPGETQYFWV